MIQSSIDNFQPETKMNSEPEADLLSSAQVSANAHVGRSVGEYILCAAIWYKELDEMSNKWLPNVLGFMRPKNINKGIVICGYRHPSCMYTMVAITGKRSVTTECGEYVQGFLTSHNRFVDRTEAAKLFVLEGGKLKYSTQELYSEDLY